MLDPEVWLIAAPILLIVGAVAGTLAGLLGVGGRIVIVPVLYWLTETGLLAVPEHHAIHFAVATSLATIIPTSIASSRAHLKKGSIDFDLFKAWGPFVFLGALLGGILAVQFDANVLTATFGLIALVVAANMANPRPFTLAEAPPVGLARRAMVATPIGGFSAMMGIGGGTLSVPVLGLMSFPTHRAVGTAALLGLVIALPGVVGYAGAGRDAEGLLMGSIGYINLPAAILISATTIVFAPHGARIAHRLNARRLRLAFAVFLALSAIKMLSELMF